MNQDLARIPQLVPHNPRAAAEAVTALMEGATLQQAAARAGVVPFTLAIWRMESPEFDLICSRARKWGVDYRVDTLATMHEDIADVQRARLASENLRWIAARVDPERYGDKISVDVHQQVSIAAPLAAGRARMLRSRRDLANVEDARIIDASAETTPQPTDTVSVDGMPSIDDLLS